MICNQASSANLISNHWRLSHSHELWDSSQAETDYSMMKEIEVSIFKWQVITVSDKAQYCYLTLIECVEKTWVRFNQDEVLQINFNVKIDDYEKDWSEIVVEHLSFAQIKQSFIVLCRLWNKKKSIYKSSSLKIIEHAYKINKELQTQC